MGQGYSTSGYADGVSYNEWSRDFGQSEQDKIKTIHEDASEIRGAIEIATKLIEIKSTYDSMVGPFKKS